MNAEILFIWSFIEQVRKKDVYEFLKDFVVPCLTIIASIVGAFWLSRRELKGQVKLKAEDDFKQKKLLFNIVNIQNQLLILDLQKRETELREILLNLKSDNLTIRPNGIYLASLTRLIEFDYKSLHELFLIFLSQKEKQLQTFLLFHNALINIDKMICLYNVFNMKYSDESIKNVSDMKELVIKFKLYSRNILQGNESFFNEIMFEFEDSFSAISNYEKYFVNNIKLVDNFYYKVSSFLKKADYDLFNMVIEIKNIGLLQKQALEHHSEDLRMFLNLSEDNRKHLEEMQKLMYSK